MEYLDVFSSWFDGNWTIPAAIILAFLGYQFLRAGVRLVVSILCVGVIIAILTHVGILPPISEILSFWR